MVVLPDLLDDSFFCLVNFYLNFKNGGERPEKATASNNVLSGTITALTVHVTATHTVV